MILGLDVGDRRVGCAIMHEEALLPVVLATIDRQKQEALSAVSALCRSNDISTVVIGFPRRQDGSESLQTQKTKQFGDELQEHLPNGVKIVYQDESVTSLKAHDELGANNIAYSKEAVDALSAVYILEDYASILQGKA